MKHTLLRLLAISSLLTGIATAADVKPPTFVPASGLQLSLETGGYKFFVGETPQPVARALRTRAATLGGLLPTNDGFAAGVVLGNSSRSDLTFEFNDAGAAQVKFKFDVTDADGALVWQSDTDLISAQVITPATLGKGKRWKRMLQIPLKVNGTWLKSGLYTLEAKLAANPSVSAKLLFEVAPATDVTGDGGISGHVLQEAPPNPLARIAPQPVKAAIRIREIRLPNARYDHPEFSYDGQTDAAGAFKVVTPAGRYKVTATAVGVPVVSTTVEVAVEKGIFTDTTITLAATAGESGVKGRVLIGPLRPVETVGVSNEGPLAGAIVTITEYQIPGVFYFRGPWVYTATANGEGRFSQAVPPGRCTVKAQQPNAVNTVAHIGFSPEIDVTVENGKFTEVTLHVDSGIR